MMEQTVVQIIDWNNTFENHRSRSIINPAFVLVPNDHNAAYWRHILLSGPELAPQRICVWFVLLQAVSRQPWPQRKHGFLMQDGVLPHNCSSMAFMTRLPVAIFEDAIPVLEDVKLVRTLPIEEMRRLLGAAPDGAEEIDGGSDALHHASTEVADSRDRRVFNAVAGMVKQPFALIAPAMRTKVREALDATNEEIMLSAIKEVAARGDEGRKSIQAVCTRAKLIASGQEFETVKQEKQESGGTDGLVEWGNTL
jgi:hypothetical protein